jgi:hypothetical protein
LDPAILLIIVFIVAPLIERLLKAGKGTQPPEQQPPQRMPPQRTPPQRIPPPQRTPPQREPEPMTAGRPADADVAAEMLPDDLWEILTGERRAPRPPVPREEPDEVVESYPVADYPEEEASLEVPTAGGWMSELPDEPAVVLPPAPYVRPLPQRATPGVVSLEDLEIDTAARHDQFHQRLETLRAPARVRGRAPNAYRFRSREDLRRAIVMLEVLGTPKGLE